MEKLIYGFMLLGLVFSFSSCEEEEEAEICKTCTLVFTWEDGTEDLQTAMNEEAEGGDLHAEFVADYEEEDVSFGEVCGDAIATSEANYAEYTEGVLEWDHDGDGVIDMTEAYTCE